MAVFRIAVIGGDGIGPEVIDEAIKAAEVAGRKHDGAELKWTRLPWSTAFYKKHGRMLPEDGWDQLKPHDAILFGAVGDPSVPDKITVMINELHLDGSIAASDVKLPEGAKLLSDPDAIIVHCIKPHVAEETPAAGVAEPGAAEPELIRKEKAEEGEEAAAE